MATVNIFANAVGSVAKPPLVLIFLPEDQIGWCKQFSEEGYNVIHVPYTSALANDILVQTLESMLETVGRFEAEFALITYGLLQTHWPMISDSLRPTISKLKACVHFCPSLQSGQDLLIRYSDKTFIPTIFHLASAQEELHANLLPLSDTAALDYELPASAYHPFSVYTYPKVPSEPPFPFLMKAPALVTAGEKSTADPHVRSATGVSLTRTLEILRRYLGPHFDLENLWEKHTYYEFVTRDAPKTMSTMVSAPYVNHVATLTGGVGYEELARFYKYHFTRETVTPPDTELITVSRTVGADRIIDEMIFKCTHTTEIDYFLPGIKPTGKPLEIALVGVVAFRGDKLFFEHIYWDQASVLVQLGLLDPNNLPVAGIEVARKVVDPFGHPSNELMSRWKESEGLPIT
ncbi:NTF2-like protein [Panus rudis PR-1116 ss-1]|nr:NTF2-like protein [Panus rudis PR-1116 ss-1]